MIHKAITHRDILNVLDKPRGTPIKDVTIEITDNFWDVDETERMCIPYRLGLPGSEVKLIELDTDEDVWFTLHKAHPNFKVPSGLYRCNIVPVSTNFVSVHPIERINFEEVR